MIKAIANQKVDLSKEESQYLDQLIKVFGEDDLNGLFKTDKQGNVIAVTPPVNKATPMALIFFLLNLMLNQRLRTVDQYLVRIEDLEKKIEALEKTK